MVNKEYTKDILQDISHYIDGAIDELCTSDSLLEKYLEDIVSQRGYFQNDSTDIDTAIQSGELMKLAYFFGLSRVRRYISSYAKEISD